MADKYDWAEAQMAVFQKIEATKESLNKLENRQDQTAEKLDKKMNDQYEKLQLHLKELSDKFDKNFAEIHTDIETLKLKSGLWGLIAGAFPGAVYVIWEFLTGRAGR